MSQIECQSRRIDHDTLRTFCAGLLKAAGLIQADAELVAAMLVATNLRGIDSHGVARLPHYLRRIQHGSIQARPNMTLERLAPAAARLDGGDGLGHLVMHRAASAAIDLARESGAGWVSVRNSTHCGALALYGLQIADAGMIGMVFTHVDPMVLPFGSKQGFCGTNPLCITAPMVKTGAGTATLGSFGNATSQDIAEPVPVFAPNADDGLDAGALCLDMATSKVPWNTVANAAMEGVPIQQGWAVDAAGRDTTRAEDVVSLYPVGEYKGSGLGLMIDVLCAMLGDSPYGPDIPKMYGDLDQKRHLGGLVGAIDIARFVPLERFTERVAELFRRWCALPPVQPGGQVLYPGQPELLTRRQRLREGIPVGLNLLHELESLGTHYGVNSRLG
jgi:ureidoglycolate dehydrogenase (NAD+)